MNKSILPVLAAGALFMLVSCDSRQKLSEDLQGVWAGTPEQLTNSGAARATMVRMMEFTSTGNAGASTLKAYVSGAPSIFCHEFRYIPEMAQLPRIPANAGLTVM